MIYTVTYYLFSKEHPLVSGEYFSQKTYCDLVEAQTNFKEFKQHKKYKTYLKILSNGLGSANVSIRKIAYTISDIRKQKIKRFFNKEYGIS